MGERERENKRIYIIYFTNIATVVLKNELNSIRIWCKTQFLPL